jgi:nitroreductase
MDVIDALKRRHMCRHFDPTPVEREKLKRLIYAATRAPSGGNQLVREIILVDEPQSVELLRSVVPSFLANSPAAFVICTDLERAAETMGRQGRDILSLLDAGAAAENIALEAVELGLGVSFVRSSTESAVREALGIPSRYRVDIIVGIGYMAKERPPPLKGQKPIIHHNRFGETWIG